MSLPLMGLEEDEAPTRPAAPAEEPRPSLLRKRPLPPRRLRRSLKKKPSRKRPSRWGRSSAGWARS